MIVNFPRFQALTIDSREDIESITSKFPPYSDFNFVSLYSWNVKDSMQIAILNDNLIVIFKDYSSDKSFLSFIGDQQIDETIDSLLDYAPNNGLGKELQLIPEHMVNLIKEPGKFTITEDRDNHDYIIPALKLSQLKGKGYHSKRTGIENFKSRNEGHFQNKQLVFDQQTSQDIVDTFHHCQQEAGKSILETSDELVALERLLNSGYDFGISGLGVYVDDAMVGYAIYEIRGEYAIGHFMKASRLYSGLYDYLKNVSATDMLHQGANYINYEQDLGLDGLRKSKLLLRPETFLKKFSIVLAD